MRLLLTLLTLLVLASPAFAQINGDLHLPWFSESERVAGMPQSSVYWWHHYRPGEYRWSTQTTYDDFITVGLPFNNGAPNMEVHAARSRTVWIEQFFGIVVARGWELGTSLGTSLTNFLPDKETTYDRYGWGYTYAATLQGSPWMESFPVWVKPELTFEFRQWMAGPHTADAPTLFGMYMRADWVWRFEFGTPLPILADQSFSFYAGLGWHYYLAAIDRVNTAGDILTSYYTTQGNTEAIFGDVDLLWGIAIQLGQHTWFEIDVRFPGLGTIAISLEHEIP